MDTHHVIGYCSQVLLDCNCKNDKIACYKLYTCISVIMLCKVQHTKSQFKWCQFAKLQDVIQCLYSIDCSAQSAHEVEEEWLAKSRLNHAYQHRCCNQETVDGLVDSKSLKRHPDVLIPKWSQMWCMHGVHSTQVYDACSIYFNEFNTDLQMFCLILFLSTTLCCVSDTKLPG